MCWQAYTFSNDHSLQRGLYVKLLPCENLSFFCFPCTLFGNKPNSFNCKLFTWRKKIVFKQHITHLSNMQISYTGCTYMFINVLNNVKLYSGTFACFKLQKHQISNKTLFWSVIYAALFLWGWDMLP